VEGYIDLYPAEVEDLHAFTAVMMAMGRAGIAAANGIPGVSTNVNAERA
jgi:hypothetical protein